MLRSASFILVFFFTCTVQTFCQQLGFVIANGEKKVSIPIEIHNNLVVVPVVLNDALPLKFIVDTGVRTAILTQKTFSDILQLPYSRKYTLAGPGGEKVIEAYVTNNVTLRLPGVTGRGHALLVLEEDYLEMRNYLGTDVHGILGYELFSRFIVQIDYSKRRMTLYLPDKFRPKRRYESLPMKVEDTKPYILTPLVINKDVSMSAKLLIDTGASHGLMLDPDSDERIVPPTNYLSSVIGRGLGGAITGKVGKINSIHFGDYKLDEVLVSFPDPNSYMDTLKSSSVFRNGSIGGDILTRFSVILNFPQERLYLRKNSSFKKEFYYNLSGLYVKAKGARLDVFEVTDVREQSAGEVAGVQVGDLVVTVNGLPTKELHLNTLNGILNSKPGKNVRLDIIRKGVRHKMTLKLKDDLALPDQS